MCVAAKGWLQGRAATLLLLWAGFSLLFFSVQQKFIVLSFFRLAYNFLSAYLLYPYPTACCGYIHLLLFLSVFYYSCLSFVGACIFSAQTYKIIFKQVLWHPGIFSITIYFLTFRCLHRKTFETKAKRPLIVQKKQSAISAETGKSSGVYDNLHSSKISSSNYADLSN